jgi:hypothetical protein
MAYQVQGDDGSSKVKVFGGNVDGTTGQPQTDFIISEAGYPDEHRHIVVDINGNVVYDQYNPNR